MTDLISPEKRSHIMSMIRGKNTKPELIVRRYLFQHGFRFRVNVRRLPGTPDIVLRKYHTAIFVNGCFWHGHEGCPDFRPPRSRVEWWTAKLRRNQERDLRVREKLRAATLEEVVRLLQRSFVETHYQAHFSPYTLPDTDDLPLAAEESAIYNRKGQTD